ncbi:hypothetical protein FA95DRAFT_1239579 [Auriscalpium vulgare]|uniref:Uncharacterized protein n=1 Tax=Auriscalpium vulgare TaxID=40419 RepID=A0ACB8S9M5_9AGAM|nr:hypothetical protein FA95DRAFT_1239579 [Auriscalpium vulgare]
MVSSSSISRSLAKVLSRLLVSLARSDVLFSSLRHSNASSIQLEQGKRKRGEYEDEGDQRLPKRPAITESPYTLRSQIEEACRAITNALTSRGSREEVLDPALVSSIQLPLHQVFLFAVTSSTQVMNAKDALQEIGGLIQVLGVLSGIQIGGPPSVPPPPFGMPARAAGPWPPPPPELSDIGTAVYPCLVPSCNKMFARLYSLRGHQRMHTTHRPFHCDFCPASFARNHDLKRHMKLHDRKAWKCAGCDKVFSRRDAIKRHKNSMGRGPDCADADVVEVEVEKGEGEDDLRQPKLWSGFANQPVVPGPLPTDGTIEEGEIDRGVIHAAQAVVLGLQPLLREYVSPSLGQPADPIHLQPLTVPTDGQATLASVIARAQTQMASEKASNPARPSEQPEYPPPVIAQAEPSSGPSTLSLYGLSTEQTLLLEQAIANAATAALLQAEAEAALEEEGLDEEEEEEAEGTAHGE